MAVMKNGLPLSIIFRIFRTAKFAKNFPMFKELHSLFCKHCKLTVIFNLCEFRKMSCCYDEGTETGMLMGILSATVAFGNIQKLYCSNSTDVFSSLDKYIRVC